MPVPQLKSYDLLGVRISESSRHDSNVHSRLRITDLYGGGKQVTENGDKMRALLWSVCALQISHVEILTQSGQYLEVGPWEVIGSGWPSPPAWDECLYKKTTESQLVPFAM